MSQFLILIYDDESAWANATPGRMAAHHGRPRRSSAQKNEEAIAGGNALQAASTATTMRPDGAGGFTVTDGPFAETKEALGGYYLVEAADLDEAHRDGQAGAGAASAALEVRPIMVFD